MNTSYIIDLSLLPTTFDLLHVCLAGTVLVLLLLLVILLLFMLVRAMKKSPIIAAPQPVTLPRPAPISVTTPPEPIVKIVEKIVHVPAPAPEPVILKEATPDAALQLLGLLQTEARFIDFIQEDITSYPDADIGIAARVVHEGCVKVMKDYFSLATVRTETEGAKLVIPEGFDASLLRLTGNIIGKAPFSGTLIHKGWKITETRLPKLTQGHDASIIAAAEVEL
jgi:hypothetical protein